MSDDLISRKALLEDMKNSITESSGTFDWINLINKQSTAYDVDKVLNKLSDVLCDEISQAVADDVAAVVKGGGVDE